MERLTKRVGCGEAVPVAEGNICAPFEKAGLCKTGTQGGAFGRWERHCNDTCVLGTIIDKLAAYEDSGLTPEEVASMARLKAAGRLKLLPCAVGDTVYEIRTKYTAKRKGKGKPYDYSISGMPHRLKQAPDTCYVAPKICTKSDMNHLGKTVFPTEVEAIEKLEEAKRNARCSATE